MQTFLPYPNFKLSAKTLDRQRLGKQRLEALDIIRVNLDKPLGASEKYMAMLKRRYRNHPIVKMWYGFEELLAIYGVDICKEWISRGYKDNMLPNFMEVMPLGRFRIPDWMGNTHFHYTHQCNLVRKKPERYSQLFGNLDTSQRYAWYDQDRKQWYYKTAQMKEKEWI